MEGVEFQLREQRPWVEGRRDYPLSLDQRVKEGDQFRLSEEKLSSVLKSIEQKFSAPRSSHTGTPDCESCGEQRRQIWQAYYDYYLGTEPDRWDLKLRNYREEMREMLKSIGRSRYTLEDVNARFEQELRDHLQKDLCTAQPDLDTVNLEELKRITLEQFDAGKPTVRILEERLDAELNLPALHSGDAVAFIEALQHSQNARERIHIYQKYYCSPSWDDTPQMKNYKAKYARLFERGMSHDSVLQLWKQEALEAQHIEISKLKHRLGELKMAQSAHLKNKAKKAEKDQRMQDREYVIVPRQAAKCSLERCEREVSLADGEVLECALCDWLARKDRSERRYHAYYCSEGHVKEDFEYHDRSEHACSMSSYCVYDPEPGPEETGQGGICPDCMDNGIVSYFCSLECYRSNHESHSEMVHYPKGIQGVTEYLEVFSPASDIEIVSS